MLGQYVKHENAMIPSVIKSLLLDEVINNDTFETITNFNEYIDKLDKYARILAIMDYTYNNEQIILNECLGFCAYYCNDLNNKISFITYILINKKYRGKKFGDYLLNSAINKLKNMHFASINLCVHRDNFNAIKLYKKYGFKEQINVGTNIEMSLVLKNYDVKIPNKKYNTEIIHTTDSIKIIPLN